jgi:hypothetical protein
LIGAFFNYYIAYYLGRKLIYSFANTKLAHLLLIDVKGVEKSEKRCNTPFRRNISVKNSCPKMFTIVFTAFLNSMILQDCLH